MKKHMLAEVSIRNCIKYIFGLPLEVAEGVGCTNKSCWQHCPCCHLPITTLYMENDVLFRLYLSFRWKDFHENLSLIFHVLYVSFPSVNNSGHFACRTKYLSWLYLSIRWRDFPETSYFLLSTNALHTM